MLTLVAKIRDKIGHGLNQLRKQGFIPGILYGPEIKSLPLIIEANHFRKIYQKAGETTLVKLNIEGEEKAKKSKERIVLITDVQRDVLTGKIIHFDLYQVKMDKPITAEVPLVFIGEAPAVKVEGGALVKNIQTVEVEALPQDLPKEIEVDVSSLKTFEDNIYIKDLVLPSGVKILAEPNEVVASVTPPEEEVIEEVPTEEAISEIKTEAEEKREKEAREKESESSEEVKE